MSSGPACQAFWTTDVVFDGTVTHNRTCVTGGDVLRPDIPGQRVRRHPPGSTELEEGIEGETVQVTTDGTARAVGSTSRWVAATWCSRVAVAVTRGLACRSAALPAPTTAPENRQRSSRRSAAPKPAGGSSEQSSRSRASFKPTNSSSRAPMDLEVRLTGNGRTLTTTAKAGRYEFSGLAAGNFRVECSRSGRILHLDADATGRDPEPAGLFRVGFQPLPESSDQRVGGRRRADGTYKKSK